MTCLRRMLVKLWLFAREYEGRLSCTLGDREFVQDSQEIGALQPVAKARQFPLEVTLRRQNSHEGFFDANGCVGRSIPLQPDLRVGMCPLRHPRLQGSRELVECCRVIR